MTVPIGLKSGRHVPVDRPRVNIVYYDYTAARVVGLLLQNIHTYIHTYLFVQISTITMANKSRQ